MAFDVSGAEAWRARYGGDEPAEVERLARLLNHHSVRHFADKPVSEALVELLIGCGASASTSSNLQLWSVVSVEDVELRQRVYECTGRQEHVLEAPWFFAFLADHRRLRSVCDAVGFGGEGLDYTEFYTMAVVDAALAAERMVCAAEQLGLGVCYIGGLRNDPPALQKHLSLPSGVFGVFGLCLGWPAEPPVEGIKPRLDVSSVWFRNRYDGNLSLDGYEARMAEHYASRGMKASVTWSERSARRVDNEHLMGREGQGPWLRAQGFCER